jgi:putative flippase GtrA
METAAFIWSPFTKQGHLPKLLSFALISQIGLALDVGLFVLLAHFGLRAGCANAVSASVAVTFVYFLSTKRVFEYAGRFLLSLFLLYAAYQAAAIVAASWAVDAIVGVGVLPVLAKGLILPVTFSANYLFLDFLTRTRL